MYENLVDVYPGPSTAKRKELGALTVVKEYPYATPKWELWGPMQTVANYFLWALDSPGNRRGTSKNNSRKFDKFNKGGKEAALFDFIISTPEFKMYKDKVNQIDKQLRALSIKWSGGIPKGMVPLNWKF